MSLLPIQGAAVRLCVWGVGLLALLLRRAEDVPGLRGVSGSAGGASALLRYRLIRCFLMWVRCFSACGCRLGSAAGDGTFRAVRGVLRGDTGHSAARLAVPFCRGAGAVSAAFAAVGAAYSPSSGSASGATACSTYFWGQRRRLQPFQLFTVDVGVNLGRDVLVSQNLLQGPTYRRRPDTQAWRRCGAVSLCEETRVRSGRRFAGSARRFARSAAQTAACRCGLETNRASLSTKVRQGVRTFIALQPSRQASFK